MHINIIFSYYGIQTQQPILVNEIVMIHKCNVVTNSFANAIVSSKAWTAIG